MLQAADSLQLTTDVVLAGRAEEVLDGRMRLIVGAENLLGFKGPVRSLRSADDSLAILRPLATQVRPPDGQIAKGWNELVGLVDVLDGHDGEVPVIAEVSQCDPLAGRQAKLLDFGLG